MTARSMDPRGVRSFVRSRRTRRIRAGLATGLRIGGAEASADYVDGTNELPVQVAIADALRPGDAFLDVGANVGFFSLLAARLVGERGAVTAVEPVPANAARIRANARRNRLTNVAVVQAAATDVAGEVTLLLAAHPGGAAVASAGPPPDPAGSIVTSAVTIDGLVASGEIRPPQVVKIDVEGSELEVLRGMESVLVDHRPVVVCEVDAETEERLAEKAAAVASHLRRRSYDVETLERSYDGSWRVEHLLARPTEVG